MTLEAQEAGAAAFRHVLAARYAPTAIARVTDSGPLRIECCPRDDGVVDAAAAA
jgi:hypothetical protein